MHAPPSPGTSCSTPRGMKTWWKNGHEARGGGGELQKTEEGLQRTRGRGSQRGQEEGKKRTVKNGTSPHATFETPSVPFAPLGSSFSNGFAWRGGGGDREKKIESSPPAGQLLPPFLPSLIPLYVSSSSSSSSRPSLPSFVLSLRLPLLYTLFSSCTKGSPSCTCNRQSELDERGHRKHAWPLLAQ